MHRTPKQPIPVIDSTEVVSPAPVEDGADRLVVRLVIVASLLMFTWMARPLFTGQVPIEGDLLRFHYPLRDFYSRALAAGHRVEWMPSLFCGFYVVGEGQMGTFHPWHWVLYRWIPLDAAMAIEMVASYPFLLAGSWMFLRRWFDTAPACFGAMLFTFCGFNLSHGLHMNMVAVVAHIPWLLLCIDAACSAANPRDRLLPCAGIALLTGSQLLLGHPQAVWFSGLIEAAFLLFLMCQRAGEFQLVVAVAAGKLLGVGIGSIQLLATIHAVHHSRRLDTGVLFADDFSLNRPHMSLLLEPYLLWGRLVGWTAAAGDEYAAYCGAVPLVLAAWWLFLYPGLHAQGRITPADRLGMCALIFGVLGLWLATGTDGGLYYFQTWLPLVRNFRCPARYMLFTQLALAVVSAVAMIRLMQFAQHGQRARWQQLWAPWVVFAASILVATFPWTTLESRLSGTTHLMLCTLAGPALFLAASGLITLAALGKRWAIPTLVLFAALDQACCGLIGVVAWQRAMPRAEILRRLAVDPPPLDGRLFPNQETNVYALSGHRQVFGYAAIPPIRRLDYHSPQVLRVAQVDYVQVTAMTGVAPTGGDWHRLRNPLPRARLVSESRINSQGETYLGELDIYRSALTTRELNLVDGTPGTATIVQDDPGDIRIRASLPTRQLLVISESYDEGWKATIDGQPAQVEKVNVDFLGCVLQSGEHTVAFRFQPDHLTVGRAISLGSLVVALAIGIWSALAPRRQ